MPGCVCRSAAGAADGGASPGHGDQPAAARGLHSQEGRPVCRQVLTGQPVVGASPRYSRLRATPRYSRLQQIDSQSVV